MMAIGYGPGPDCIFCSITPEFLCLEARRVLKEINADLKRKLPEDAPADFTPKRLLPLVETNGKPDRMDRAFRELDASRTGSGELKLDTRRDLA
jgi:hypothetical protein